MTSWYIPGKYSHVLGQRGAGAPVGPSRFWHDSSFAETTTKNFIGILRVIAALLFATFPIRPLCHMFLFEFKTQSLGQV